MQRRDGASSELVMAALAEVEDPELPLSVIDLGLIYGVTMHGRTVTVTMTLTSLACPAQRQLTDAITHRLGEVPGVDEVRIELVWSPPWTTAMLTEHGRRRLHSLGIAA